MTTKLRLLFATLLFGAGVLTGAYIAYPTPVPPSVLKPLPPSVPVTIVKEVKVPGPPPPARIVEHVKLVTVPAPAATTVLHEAASWAHPLGRVRLEATKFQGLRDGKPAFGWKGKALCELAPAEKPDDWLLLAESPLDLTQSVAEMVPAASLVPPPAVRRNRFDLGLGASSSGAFLSASLHRRILHKSTVGTIFAPDWMGAGVSLNATGNPTIFATLGKEF